VLTLFFLKLGYIHYMLGGIHSENSN
jgi:hypothetical protein